MAKGHQMMARRLGPLGALLVAIGLGAGWAAVAASAHVTVAAPGVVTGASDAVITIRVPDESDNASTTGLTLKLPTDHPIAGVLVAPQAGWRATIKQSKLATPVKTDDGDITEVVSEIDWVAAPGSSIGPGFFGEFSFIAGKLPDDASTLTFKAIQSYSDGKVVSWIQQPAPGSSPEPDFPAPTLVLPAADGSTASGSPAAGSPAAGSASPHASAATSAAGQFHATSQATARTGVVLGAIAVLLAAVALAVALTKRRRPGRPAS